MRSFYENTYFNGLMKQKGLAYNAYYLNVEEDSGIGFAVKIGLFFYLEDREIAKVSWVKTGDREVLLANKHVMVMGSEIENLADDELDTALEAVRLELLFS